MQPTQPRVGLQDDLVPLTGEREHGRLRHTTLMVGTHLSGSFGHCTPDITFENLPQRTLALISLQR